ncbi:MAG: polyamine aminopropyltransferase [Gammaproteobacteria bacterium]|nr:polyamine aminopropyltransferase [Gammaproteobacteria bacterium]
MANETVRVRRHDAALIGAIGMVAACGLVYEYLLAHYAGRILGAVEPTLYAMIGLMIVAMGCGALAARWISSIYRGFAWLELGIGILGGTSILLLSGAVALAYSLPEWLRAVYNLDAAIVVDGGLAAVLLASARVLPFVVGFAIGFLVGMEIPLIARVREHIHQRRLEHNLGAMYGADYIGAGVGAAIWVAICLKIPVIYAAVGTAAVNTLVGFGFLSLYRRRLRPSARLWIGHALLAGLLVVLAVFGTEWTTRLGDTLFQDRVVYRLQTPYQNAVVTKRHVARGKPDVLSLYINGRLQFASNDERIYHAYLTTPAMLATYRRERLLVLGGGDGLALRDLLRWDPDSVTLIDIDPELVGLFAGEDPDAPAWLSRALVELNENAFADPCVTVIQADAFIEVERLAAEGESFDVVVADLPDPGHPDLNRLYSDYFYGRIGQLLSPDGVLAVQSTSPFHAKAAFLSIGRTVSHVGFDTEQFHANVPSFGEWGWTVGTLRGKSVSERIAKGEAGPTPDGWLDRQQILAAFAFPNDYYRGLDDIRINRLGSHAVYGYHQEALQEHRGVFFAGRSGSRQR